MQNQWGSYAKTNSVLKNLKKKKFEIFEIFWNFSATEAAPLPCHHLQSKTEKLSNNNKKKIENFWKFLKFFEIFLLPPPPLPPRRHLRNQDNISWYCKIWKKKFLKNLLPPPPHAANARHRMPPWYSKIIRLKNWKNCNCPYSTPSACHAPSMYLSRPLGMLLHY